MATAPFTNQVVSCISEVLRPAGFRKTGSVFSREVNDVLHIVGLQSSTSSTASSLRITVNIGVVVPTLLSSSQQPDVWSSHWRQRIGMLMSERSDLWWSMSTEQEAHAAGAEIAAAVQQFALPALSAIENAAALARLWKSGVSPGLTQVQAQRYLHRLYESPSIG
jgi:hypothetical protein